MQVVLIWRNSFWVHRANTTNVSDSITNLQMWFIPWSLVDRMLSILTTLWIFSSLITKVLMQMNVRTYWILSYCCHIVLSYCIVILWCCCIVILSCCHINMVMYGVLSYCCIVVLWFFCIVIFFNHIVLSYCCVVVLWHCYIVILFFHVLLSYCFVDVLWYCCFVILFCGVDDVLFVKCYVVIR